MKEKILQLLGLIQGLQILEVGKDYYWHNYEGSIADVQSWIWVAPTTSRSVQAASTLKREIEAKLRGQEDWSRGSLNQTPKWKGDFLHLGMVSTSKVIGKEYGTQEFHCTDPEIADLKSETVPEYSFTKGRMGRRYERYLVRVIVIVICPNPEIHKDKKKLIFPNRYAEELKLLRQKER